METRTEVITPEIAKAMLQKNYCNRPLYKDRVLAMASDMAAGRWCVTHQGLWLGADGVLLDGQNRLHAVVKAGVPVQMRVTRSDDVTTALRVPVDTGRTRTPKDVLGVTNTAAAVAGLVFRLLRGRHPSVAETDATVRALAPYQGLLPVGGKAPFGRATARVAAVVRLIEGQHNEYVIDSFTKLARHDPQGLAPAPYSLFRQFVVVHNPPGNEQFVKTLRALDHSHRNTTKLPVRDMSVAIKEANALAREMLLRVV